MLSMSIRALKRRIAGESPAPAVWREFDIIMRSYPLLEVSDLLVEPPAWVGAEIERAATELLRGLVLFQGLSYRYEGLIHGAGLTMCPSMNGLTFLVAEDEGIGFVCVRSFVGGKARWRKFGRAGGNGQAEVAA